MIGIKNKLPTNGSIIAPRTDHVYPNVVGDINTPRTLSLRDMFRRMVIPSVY